MLELAAQPANSDSGKGNLHDNRISLGNEITMLYGVPSTFGAIVGFSDLERYDLGSLVQCASGGAPLPDAVRSRFTERIGMPLAQGYALTETTSLAVREFAGLRKPGAVGLPTPHTRGNHRRRDGVDLARHGREPARSASAVPR